VLDRLAEIADAEFLQNVSFLPIPGLDISSTDLRRRVREGRGIKYLTPDAVQTYIARRGLYRPILKNPGEEDTP
jgi:nicotinate-nucleotide adenylyltransferase